MVVVASAFAWRFLIIGPLNSTPVGEPDRQFFRE
jgi:hypothetical protein